MKIFKVKRIGRLYLSMKLENELSWIEGTKGDRRYFFFHCGLDDRPAFDVRMKIITVSFFFISLGIGLTPPLQTMSNFYRRSQTSI